MNIRSDISPVFGLEAEERLKRIEHLVSRTYAAQRPNRIRPTEETKDLLLGTAAKFYGGLCPCCATNEVVDRTGKRSPLAEFDHWFDNPAKSLPHQMWIICAPCHSGFTRGALDRQDYMIHWHMFQQRRRDFQHGRQLTLRI